MEKLQSAIDAARKARGEVKPSTVRPVLERPRGKPEKRDDAQWNDLPKADLDKQHLVRNRIVTASPNKIANNFDILRTKILLLMQRNNWTRVAITSPTPNCGKTTTVCNLAIGIGRQSALRTILFDLDLRRPSVAKLLGCEPPREISDLLGNKTEFSSQAVRVRDNVAISAATAPSRDPTQLLLQEKNTALLDQIEQTYKPDFMLFDMPPVLISDDARAFLRHVDCAIIVARAESSTAKQIDTCEKEVGEHTNVLGVVLNRCRHISDMYDEYEDHYK